MELAKLLLDYIKTLIWPVILLVIIFSYEKEVVGLFENREIDAFGLKIGARIEDFSNNYENEIRALKAAIAKTENNDALIKKVEAIEKNASRELAQVQQSSTNIKLIENRSVSKLAASTAERAGFQAILDRNIDVAISQFQSARKIWPEYHNVAELEKVLSNNKQNLTNENAWIDLEQLILQKYSWGMPEDIRRRFNR
ncbi:hypothetical protein ACVBE9_11805 [Eionea flava]